MATRPLTPLGMQGWGFSRGNYAWRKEKGSLGGVVNFYSPYHGPTYFSPEEVRSLHTWLGKVVEDLDAGV